MRAVQGNALLRGELRGHWRRYLLPALGGAAVTSVYSIVDTVAIGYGVGADGVAAAAVLVPSFGLMAFLGTLFGMGGAVLLATARGRGRLHEGNAWFTLAFLLTALVGVAVSAVVLLTGDLLWVLSGADRAILPLVREYGLWVVLTWPCAMLSLFLSLAIRNDGAPRYVLGAVIVGGCLNIVGDWLLVFPFKVGTGMAGAGIATAAGCLTQTLLLLGYLLRARCGLRFLPPRAWPRGGTGRICAVGFSTALPHAATAAVSALINVQALRHGGVAALSVFGACMTVFALFQQLAIGVAEALQPIVSLNFGAQRRARIRRAFWLAARTSALMGGALAVAGLLFPQGVVRLFMRPTPEIVAVAPGIVRGLACALPPMALTILAAGYLQTLLRTVPSIGLALLRSLILSLTFLLLLPPLLGLAGVWLAITATEWLTLAAAALALLALWGKETQRREVAREGLRAPPVALRADAR